MNPTPRPSRSRPSATLLSAAFALLAAAVAAGGAPPLAAQGEEVRYVPLSQPGSVSQTVNTTDISVHYNRPGARGREIFGGIVRWEQRWNPGANDATWLEVTRDVRIGGKELPSGRYSLWIEPRPDGPWEVIFSRDWDVFHTPYPDGTDALRLEVSPAHGEHMEALAFYFHEVGPDHTVLRFHWGETILPFRIDVERVLPVRDPG